MATDVEALKKVIFSEGADKCTFDFNANIASSVCWVELAQIE